MASVPCFVLTSVLPKLYAVKAGAETRRRSVLAEAQFKQGKLTEAAATPNIVRGGEIMTAWSELAPAIANAIASRTMTAAGATAPLIPEPANEHPRLWGVTALIAAPNVAAPQLT